MIRTGWGQELDEKALLGAGVISDARAAQADRFLRIVSVGTLVFAMALVAGVAYLRGLPRMALIAAGSIATAVVVTELLKLVILERPGLTSTTLNLGDNSYPSGHTTVGMAVCLAVMLVVPVRLRWATAFGAGTVGAAFGVAVVAAGWHRPSDAVGAYLVCLSIAAIAALAIRAFPDRAAGSERTPGRLRIGQTEVALGAVALALIALFGVAALSARGIPFFSAGVGFLISAATVVVAALAATVALSAAMNAADARPPETD